MDSSVATPSSDNSTTTSVLKRTMDMLNAFQAQIIQKDEEIMKLKEQVAASHALICTQNAKIAEYEENDEELRHLLWNISEEHCKLKKEWLSRKEKVSMHEAEKKGPGGQLKAQLAEAIHQKESAEKNLQEMKGEMCCLEMFLDNMDIQNVVNKKENTDSAVNQDRVNTEIEMGKRGESNDERTGRLENFLTASMPQPLVPNNQGEATMSITQPVVANNQGKSVTTRKIITNSNPKTFVAKKILKAAKVG